MSVQSSECWCPENRGKVIRDMSWVRATRTKKRSPTVEEFHFRSDNPFLCLLLNRRTRSIRLIDFRVGAHPAKRMYVQAVAQREGIEKVIILVEKQEVSAWTRVGFVREGTVPGFYKNSDGYLVGCVINDKTASIEVSNAGQKLAEQTVGAAKREAEDIKQVLHGIRVKATSEKRALTARDLVWDRNVDALGTFDNFGRDATRLFVESVPKKGRTNFLSAEFQDCFSHSLVEVLKLPKTDAEVLGVVAGLRAVNEELIRRNIVSAFAFAPSNHIGLGTAFIAAGYRKTGLLANGVVAGGKRSDAILWTRRLIDPRDGEVSDDDDPGQ